MGAGKSSIEMTPVHSGTKAGRVTVLPKPVILKVGRISSETAVAPRFQMYGLGTVSTTRRNGRGPVLTTPLKVHGYSRVHVANLQTVTQS